MCMQDMKNGLYEPYELVDFLKQCFYVQKSKMELFLSAVHSIKNVAIHNWIKAQALNISFKVSKLPSKS